MNVRLPWRRKKGKKLAIAGYARLAYGFESSFSRRRIIAGLVDVNISSEEKVAAFLDHYGTISREEFNKLKGLRLGEAEWQACAGNKGMDSHAASEYFA